MLALALILQAYTGVSDDEVIEATLMDRRWQLALDCLDAEEPPFSKGTLVAFRTRLIEHQMDRRLLERTVEIAAASKAFGPRNLRAALDSSPLWGAGRVEDTYNLLGHALRKALSVIAREQGRELAAIAGEADAELVGGSSLKAALDLDGDDPQAREQALWQVIGTLERVEQWMASNPELITEESVAPACLKAAQQVRTQDVTINDPGEPTLIKGVAKDRRSNRRKARKCPCRIFGARISTRCPVRGLIVPNKTRFALRPLIAMLACAPRNARPRRKIGNSLKIVSSSNSSTASAGIRFSFRTIALFSECGADLSLHRSNADAYSVARSLSSADAAYAC
jgi:hypothetical protein